MSDSFAFIEADDIEGYSALPPESLNVNARNSVSFSLTGSSFFYSYLTPLMFAFCHGREKFVPLLLKQKPDLNAVDGRGRQAVHYGAEFGPESGLNALLKAGANPLATDSRGVLLVFIGFQFIVLLREIRRD
jgi:ankyrin repeat protein